MFFSSKHDNKYSQVATTSDNAPAAAADSAATGHRSRSGSLTSHYRTTSPFCWRVSIRLILLLLISLLTLLVFLILGNIALPAGWQGVSLLRTLHDDSSKSCSETSTTAANDAVDVANVRAIVAGQRECTPVLDEHGLPNGNFSYKPTSTKMAQRVENGNTIGLIKTSSFKHPLIVHYIRIVPVYEIDDEGGRLNRSSLLFDFSWTLSRVQYLSIRSAWRALLEAKQFDDDNDDPLQQQQPGDNDEEQQPTIYLHSNVEPSGPYYVKLMADENINVKWNFIEYKQNIGGRKVDTIEHEADFHKVNATYTFGGVHSDFDVLLVNGTSLRRLQNSAECFSTVDVNARSTSPYAVKTRHGFNFMLNCGLFSCVKKSEFLRIWRDSYFCDYRADEWVYNSGFFPRLLLDAYKANPIALDWQTGMSWRTELLNEKQAQVEKSVEPSFVSKLQADWLTFPGLHFYHVEHYKVNWQILLRTSTSIFAQAMRLARFGDPTPATSNIDWD